MFRQCLKWEAAEARLTHLNQGCTAQRGDSEMSAKVALGQMPGQLCPQDMRPNPDFLSVRAGIPFAGARDFVP